MATDILDGCDDGHGCGAALSQQTAREEKMRGERWSGRVESRRVEAR